MRFAEVTPRRVIMANRPSLGRMDLLLLAFAPTVGENRVYLLFDRLSFVPTHCVAINELVLRAVAAEERRP